MKTRCLLSSFRIPQSEFRISPRSCRCLLFRSAAEAYGPRVLALVLTGMGQDGLRGSEAVRARGGSVVVESETTAVVTAMPTAVASAGLAYRVLPIAQMAPEVVRRTRRGGTP